MNVRRWRRVTVLAVASVFMGVLLGGAIVAPHSPLARPSEAAVAVLGVGSAILQGSSLTSANTTCPTSGPLGGLNTTDSILIFVVTAIAGIGMGISIGWRWASGGGGGAGKVIEPPDPALNPQPLPPGDKLPGGSGGGDPPKSTAPPDPALNPQPLPPGFKPPGPSSGGDRPS